MPKLENSSRSGGPQGQPESNQFARPTFTSANACSAERAASSHVGPGLGRSSHFCSHLLTTL